MAETFAEGGRGRKKCDCGVFVAGRVSTCPKCGHVFVSRSAEEKARLSRQPPAASRQLGSGVVADEAETGRPDKTDAREVLVVPSGACPVRLEGTDLAVVQAWSARLCDAVPTHRVSRSAALQYARQFYPPHTEGYRTVRAHLERCSRLCGPS